MQNAGLTFGTPFFMRYARVGVMDDVGELIEPDVVILLIADRDVVCNIFESGGTNPLEAGTFVVQFAPKMRKSQVSGVKLKLAR